MLNIHDDNSSKDDENEIEEESLDVSQSFIDQDLEKLIGTKKKEDNEQNLPKELYILPLTRRPFFPRDGSPSCDRTWSLL